MPGCKPAKRHQATGPPKTDGQDQSGHKTKLQREAAVKSSMVAGATNLLGCGKGFCHCAAAIEMRSGSQ